ncbi:MAG: cardiolipin synthase [Erysipelotrichaceae bacterium]|nr:cardiolipin synthase [Erysipelotrichaceae bacterium]
MNKIIRWIRKFLSSRIFMLVVIISLQLLILIFGMNTIRSIEYVDTVLNIIDFLLILHVVNRHTNTSYKLIWSIIIYAIPLIGGVIYLMFAERKVPKNLRNEMTRSLQRSEGLLTQNKEYQDNLQDRDLRQQFDYVLNVGSYPYYQNSSAKYFSDGMSCFEDMLAKIRKARYFIFLEYFIVKDGVMLRSLIKELLNKVDEGVKVYFMYDDGGSLTSLPDNFKQNLNDRGIHCTEFSKVSAYLSLMSKTNNRNHRKICVIDNKYAYLGGFNIGDEYIDEKIRFGKWKDCGIRISGKAVNSVTIMFIQFYNAMVSDAISYHDYLLDYPLLDKKGFFQPFSSSPSTDDYVARTVHLNLINHAKDYIYISTPYLILDHGFTTALVTASRNGVEVVINVPHIPDKKTVFMVTRSNYEVLVKNGIRVFEYTPGFMHSKNIIVDDKIAIVGSINMDYRSYYLNYECGVLIGEDKVIMDIKKDYLKCIAESQEIGLNDIENISFIVRIARGFMKLLSPLF